MVTNLFIFGSPQAQRSGQQIRNTPTAALAQRFGPIPTGAGDPWSLESVQPDWVVLAYANAAPVIPADTYISNLTPVNTNEVFYRRVTYSSDDPGTKRLTLFTTNVPLAEILQEGSGTLSKSSVIYSVDTQGAVTRALCFEEQIQFDPIGLDAPQTLYDQDGVTLKLKEAKFLFTPSLTLAFETRYFSLKRFSAELEGRLEAALVPELVMTGTLEDTNDFEIYSHKLLVYVGQVGPVPIWLDFDFNISAEVGYSLSADATMTTGVRQNVELGYGVDYIKDRSPKGLCKN